MLPTQVAWCPAAWTEGFSSLDSCGMKAEEWAAEHVCPAVKALTYGLSSGSSGTMLVFMESSGHL